MTLEGVLPVIKPVDFTSHDVVAKVRGILGIRRIGHTGTLDPKVTGVLPLCIGRATRVVEYIQDLPKQYEAVLTVGLATDTEDMTGTVIERVEKVDLTEADIHRVFAKFLGIIDQVPPMYSAIKVDGQRLYDLARQGQVIERKSRQVEIYELELIKLDLELDHPQIKFRVKCSKGTYIRTLCVDMGQALGYPAVMSELVRTATGPILLADCITLEELSELAKKNDVSSRMIATDQAIAHLPSCQVSELEALHAMQGKKIHLSSLPNDVYEDQEIVRLYSNDERFLGLFRWQDESKSFSPEKVFN
ncbi:tRNA pseudouridine(55) synthase TruB [Paenibacillus psychroresistens]|uniref:tRNA pseudouridine synthase B n=1 Tax=Paenibacillus psychroresistens TaxID=1778678 RepID=A0A6B8RKJ5_9BACL|nr:tRNA pseudouridine(55) synthase TruB [Paenibacillus psychroresistens]QGQ96274.1 tRNA pseudouridine(55) synthase TruB [Paenibacillus psychroresistens]